MHKLCSDKLTAGLLSGDFDKKVCEFIEVVLKEQQLTGKNSFDVLAMVKQLRIRIILLLA